MKEAAEESRKKKCPVCEKEYPEEDVYCGDDGSALKQTPATSGKLASPSAGTAMKGGT
jgi:hypothetical protein